MSSRAELKAKAKSLLDGKRGKAALIFLVYVLTPIVFAFIPFIGPIVNAVLTPALSYGLIKTLIDLRNGEEVGTFDFFTKGCKDFTKAWGVGLCTVLKMLAPLLLGIIGYFLMMIGGFMFVGSDMSVGIQGSSALLGMLGSVALIASSIWTIPLTWKYIYVANELAYDSSRSSMDIVNTSGKYMVGNRWNAFVLDLSFIGWSLLVTITFGILGFWVIPYMLVTRILFYEEISGRTENTAVEEPEVIKTEE